MPDDWDDGRIYAKLSDEDADKVDEYDIDYVEDGYEGDWYYEDEDENEQEKCDLMIEM